ncbi:hypothetical protein D3C84_838950 [compost metagenome]
MDRLAAGIFAVCSIERLLDLLSLVGKQHIQLAELDVRLPHGFPEQLHEVSCHTLRRLPLEQGGGILEYPVKSFLLFTQR